LYADKMTGSMERAIGETDRRRDKQIEFNLKNNITPIGVKKSVTDIMEGAHAPGARGKRGAAKGRKVAEPTARYGKSIADMSPQERDKEIKRLEQKMHEHAKNLEFEEAAQVRDELAALKYEALS